MKKIYLLLMLFLGCVGSVSAQFSVKYDFSKLSNAGQQQIPLNESVSYSVNLTDKFGPGGGYNNGWGEDNLKVFIGRMTFQGINGEVPILAFHNKNWNVQWESAINGNLVRNQGGAPNILSILNLRAGEIVRIKAFDLMPHDFALKNRFIINHSPNAIDNCPWDDPNGTKDVSEWTQEFIMIEDGNLDLKVQAWGSIETIEIISKYKNFYKRTYDGNPISLQIPSGWRQITDGTWKINQVAPVVLYRGDLKPGSMDYSITYPNNQTMFNISISGFSGMNYDNGYWEGGSIIVMVDETMYTITVPYKVANQRGNAQPYSASWNFWQKELKIGRSGDPIYSSLLAHDISEGAFRHRYTVHEGQNDQSQPLSLYQGNMNGQNAYYNSETAGLIFEGNAGVYGLLNETTEPLSDGDRWIALRKGGKMTIPALERGDQVWVYIDHYGSATTPNTHVHKNTTLSMFVSGAKDALGVDIDSSKPIVTGGSTWGPAVNGKWPRQYYAAMHFFAKGGDMTFTVDGDDPTNYAKICYIKILKGDTDSGANGQNIMGNIEPTNSILTYDNKGYEFLTTQTPNGTYATSTGTFGLHESGRGSGIQRYDVLECSGTLNLNDLKYYSKEENAIPNLIGPYNTNIGTNQIKYRYTTQETANFGSFLLRAMDFDHEGKYCLDYADRVIAVGFLQTMNYPYTWDLTDILNTSTGNSENEFKAAYNRTDNDTTKIWLNENGVISLQNNIYDNVNNRTYASGSQLFGNNTFIEEAAGLGFATINMDKSFNGSLQVTEGGLKIQTYNGWEHRLYIPGINKNGRLYVRGKKLNNGKFFTVKALREAAMGPNTMKNRTDDRVELTRIMTSDATEAEELFNYEGSFNNLFEEGNVLKQNKTYDENMFVTATESNPVEEKVSSSRIVDNTSGLFTTADVVYRTELRDDGNGGKIQWVVEDNHVYQNNDNSSLDNAIYDLNVIKNDDLEGDSYSNLLDLGGSGSTSSRTIKLTGLPETNLNLTIVARANQPRQLNIYSGDWGGSLLATMICRDALMAKTLETNGASSITIGSKNSGIEIYAIYITQDGEAGSGVEDYIGYVDVTAAQGGVTLYLNDIIIEKIGYSTDEKTVNIKGYASESRDHYIDHNLTEYFCNVPVKAYTATIEGTDYTKAIMTPLKTMEITSTASNNTGCILYSTATGDDKSASFNLFVPDIHDYLQDTKISQSFIGNTCTNSVGNNGNADQNKIAVMGNNIMIGVVDGVQKLDAETTVGGTTYVNYVLQYQYIDYYGNLQSGEEKLYRVNRDGIKLGKNKAYARFDKSIVGETHYGYVNGIKLWFGDEEEDADGIEEINISDSADQDGSTDVYYNLNGVRINKPQKSGIYVKNGKKVYIK